jgi:hypothetical protein
MIKIKYFRYTEKWTEETDLKNEENQEDILEFFEILSHQVFQVS